MLARATKNALSPGIEITAFCQVFVVSNRQRNLYSLNIGRA